MNARDRRVERAQLKTLFTVPFFAPGVARLPVVWDETIETACTDGEQIKWNPQFFDKCQDQEIVTVMCEEVCHCLLGHLWRHPPDAKDSQDTWARWNGCADQETRWMMREFSEQVTAKSMADPFPFPDPEKFAPSDEYRGMAAEQVWARMRNQPPQPSGGGAKPGRGSGNSKPQQMPSFGEFAMPKKDKAQQQKSKTDWEHVLIQSVEATKNRGTLPGSLERFINQMLHPAVPWHELLRNWLREQVNDDFNWMKPNPYFDECDFILPSLDSERMGAVVFATDTSGSIDAQMLAQFQTEKQACLDDMRPTQLLDLCCDAEITQEREYRPGDTIDKRAPGGGGTDFRPVFDRCEKLVPPPKCLVYLTDLWGTFPKHEPAFPVLWVCWSDQTGPFGETVQVK